MKFFYIIICLQFTLFNVLIGQCFEADASIWKNSWNSCQFSQNPKSEYGNTHWILYDFGVERTLSKTWVWNINDPQSLDKGFRMVKVDYSSDGSNWTYWGEMEFPMAKGEAVYSGFEGPDLQNIKAQYVLITPLSNYGHPSCSGIAEIKFNLMPNTELPPIQDNEDNDELCASIEEIHVEEVLHTEAFILWDFFISEDQEEEELEFIFEFGISEDDYQSIEIDEAEIFLEDLEPNTTYYFRILIECEESFVASEIYSFTTLDCPTVQDIEMEVEEDEALIFWDTEYEAEFFFVQILNEEGEEVDYFETEEWEIWIEDIFEFENMEVLIGIECGESVKWSSPFVIDLSGIERTTSTSSQILSSPLKLKLYPNPVEDAMNFIINSNGSDNIYLSLTDIHGRKVHNESFSVSSGLNSSRIDMSSLTDGVYYVTVISERQQSVISKKIIKLN